MPLDFAGFFLQNSIENTIIASRIHLMDLVAKYPHITYPRLDKNLKADPAILKRVFLNNNDNFILVKYVPEELKKNQSFLLQLIKRNVLALGIADEKLLNDLSFIKKAILTNSKSAFYLYDQFQEIYKNDKKEYDELEAIFLQAIKKQDYELASKFRGLINFIKLHSKGEVNQLKIDKIDFDLTSFKQLNYKPDFSHERIVYLNRNIKDLNSQENFGLLDSMLDSILYSPELYHNDKEVALKLLNEVGYSICIDDTTKYILTRLSDTLKNDRDIALQELKKNGLMLEYFSEEIKNNPELVTIAIENNIDAYFLASSELRQYNKDGNNKELLLKVINKNASFILHVNKDWLKEEEIISLIKMNSPILFELINK
jgi:hypothetical protein